MPETEGRDVLVELARRAVGKCVLEGATLSAEECPELFRAVEGRAGAFVTLRMDGRLRGCIGTFEPGEATLAEEIVRNAVRSCTRDPRFSPVRPDELDRLQVSVDVLGEPEPVPDATHLDPGRYGVIVRSGRRLGLLLPDLEGVDTAEEQLKIARSKAGIGADEPVELFRFEVSRHQ